MQFWHSFEVLQDRENPSSDLHSSASFVFGKDNGVESVKDTEEPIVSQVVFHTSRAVPYFCVCFLYV